MYFNLNPKKDLWEYFSVPFTFDIRQRYTRVSPKLWVAYLLLRNK